MPGLLTPTPPREPPVSDAVPILKMEAISKRFPLHKEGAFVQFRAELFHAFNHTQWSGVSSGTSFRPPTSAELATETYSPTDPTYGTKTYGQINGARGPRIIELSVRAVF